MQLIIGPALIDTSMDGVNDLLHGLLAIQGLDLMESLVNEADTSDSSLAMRHNVIKNLYDVFMTISCTRSPDQKLIASNILSVCLASSESLNLVHGLIVREKGIR